MKIQDKREIIINQLLSKENAAVEDYKGYSIFTYFSNKGHFVFGTLPDKKGKLENHFAYRTIQERDLAISKFKVTQDNNELRRIEQEKISEANKAAVKVGDIFYSSWGYEQTNIDFYKILERKNSTIKVVRIGEIRTYERDDCGQTMPNPEKVCSEPFIKRIDKYGGFKINSYATAFKWDENPKYWSSYA